MSEGITFENALENLRKPSSMFLSSNWTFQRLLNILKSAIDSQYNITVWATDISYLTTDLTELKKLVLYITGLETIDDIEKVKSMLFTIKEAVELDFPNIKLTCNRYTSKPVYEIYTTRNTYEFLRITDIAEVTTEEPFAVAIPKDYDIVNEPIIFLDKNNADLYDGIKLDKGILKVEDISLLAGILPYFVP